jgi:putative peptide zinc metalloprotease protein
MARENGEIDATLWSQAEEPVPLSSIDREGRSVIEPVADGDRADGGATAASRRAAAHVSAADFAAERMLRIPAQRPSSGWRLALFRGSGGLVRVGLSTAEVERLVLIARVKTPIRGCRKIAFISRKGGVGKTSTCLLTGHTFAAHRGDRVIALDGNPDAGTLGHRVRRETHANLTSLLADASRIERYADIRGYTSQAPTRLEVVASDDDPRITQAIGEAEFKHAIGLLERHYNLVCLDTGTGVLESATRGILGAADQIVVVSAPSLDGARAASSTLDWLEQNGYERLVDGAVAVINAVRPTRGVVDIDQIENHFASRCRACLRLPWDPHLEAGAEILVEALRPETTQAYLELAAAIAVGFSEATERRS